MTREPHPTAPLLSVIIPVYNEARTIAPLLDRVLHASMPSWQREIIVVDDGSTDGTGQILDDYADGPGHDTGVTILHLPVNTGKTAAIRAGLPHARGDVVLIQDADLEYSPDDYRKLLIPFAASDVQVVYGSRFLHVWWPEKMRLRYWLANKLFTLLVNRLYHARLTDEGTGYKLFRREVILALEITSNGFRFCAEATCKLLEKGIPIVEVPISYRARSSREGKKPRLQDGIGIIATIFSCRFEHSRRHEKRID